MSPVSFISHHLFVAAIASEEHSDTQSGCEPAPPAEWAEGALEIPLELMDSGETARSESVWRSQSEWGIDAS